MIDKTNIAQSFHSNEAGTGFDFERKELNILDFGAVGDGKKINTAAIQKAIDACAGKGGGRVLVPKGNFLTGTFILKSKVNLHIEKDGVILGSPYKKDYPEQFLNDPRYKRSPHQSLLYAGRAQDIMISGEGTIDGNAQLNSTGDFRDTGNNAVRPPLLWFDECSNLTIKDIIFKQSLMYTVVCERCRHVHVDHITITENYFYNADGVDIIDCEDFLVENCDINCDDDGICLKSGSEGGCRSGTVRNNKVRSLCNAIKMGTASSGGFRDILVENNEVWETGISGIALEIVDGGIMENIMVRNITMNGVGTPLTIRLGDRNRPPAGSSIVTYGIIRNIYISNIRATVSKAKKFNEAERNHHDYLPYASSICGIPGSSVDGVTIENIDIVIEGGFPVRTINDARREIPEVSNKYPENRMFGVLPAYGFYIRHARNIRIKDVRLSIRQKDERSAILLDDVYQASVEIARVETVNPSPLISINENCRNIQLGRKAGMA